MLRRGLPPCVALAGLLVTGCAYDPERDPLVPDGPRVEGWEEEVIINAPRETVWSVLVDFGDYARWNPWLVEAEGVARVGEGVAVRVVLDDEVRRARHKVTRVDPGRRFCWRDAGGTTAFVQAQRCRSLEDLGAGRTRFVSEIELVGAFRRMALRKYGAAMRRGLAAETEALARRAEQCATGATEPDGECVFSH